ncbi:hypothetical protein ACWGDT_05880 [Streptomyces avermitilis]
MRRAPFSTWCGCGAPGDCCPVAGEIDTLFFCLTRSDVLASRPFDECLDLLGTCRRDLPVPRTLLAELPAGCPADVTPRDQEDEDRARRLLRIPPLATAGPRSYFLDGEARLRRPGPGRPWVGIAPAAVLSTGAARPSGGC